MAKNEIVEAVETAASKLLGELQAKLAKNPGFYGSATMKVSFQAGKPQIHTTNIEETTKL